MASYSVAEAKDKLPSLLNAALRGEPVTITRRGKPIANLTAAIPVATDGLAYGSTAWLLAEIEKLDLPPAATDAATLVRAVRDETAPW